MYGFSRTLRGPVEQIVSRVTEELAKEGFGILTEIDVQATLKKKLDVDMLGYRILGACNPVLANQAIASDPDIGMLLPCNVLVREEGNGEFTVAFADPEAMMGLARDGLAKGDELAAVAAEAGERLQRVAARLEQGG
ncbi:MAG: DUF302 domain-containing protein [Gammaproteobacteria bacterium]|nr:DUF302 domain-containing protein [Gammaproteobacteria bacterium]